MTINSECANSGKPIKIEFDSDLNVRYVDDGSDPMICVPKVNLVETKESSIVDIF
ncbi:hypothetical protein ACFL27_09985 [candidate division CSSED10-310 bacterium]|uniref:Uncharacterized protein n=1 Tax=candidate division CSSED10-310 bacterium TaxID=2855610 RepID=A0ABV6YWF4_UNCC1